MANIWTDWLRETPDAAWGALRPQQGSFNFLNYWKGQQDKVYDDYMAELGSMANQGLAPTLDFFDFLKRYPFMQRWSQYTGSQGGLGAPRAARWNVFGGR